LTLAFGLSGCWNPFSPGRDPGDGDPVVDRTKPNRLLEFFATAYEDKDIVSYGESLDEFYTFEFDPEDYGDAGVSPEKPYWGKSEDLDHTGKMFASADTKAIIMDLREKMMEWYADTFDIDGKGTFVDGFSCLIHPLIDVTIEGKPGEEPVTKQVRNSRITVAVIPDRQFPGLWTILKITERVVK
jgi:hypothetical protein